MEPSSVYFARAARLRLEASEAFFTRNQRRLRAQAHDLERAGWATREVERAQRAATWDARRSR
ncbi:MAG: hypothetical protein QOI63_742 [Thermoplasmata archaeon]|jgi:hypothetical protein|nr:hypothetical protein [Thermoplasmata archaeon]